MAKSAFVSGVLLLLGACNASARSAKFVEPQSPVLEKDNWASSESTFHPTKFDVQNSAYASRIADQAKVSIGFMAEANLKEDALDQAQKALDGAIATLVALNAGPGLDFRARNASANQQYNNGYINGRYDSYGYGEPGLAQPTTANAELMVTFTDVELYARFRGELGDEAQLNYCEWGLQDETMKALRFELRQKGLRELRELGDDYGRILGANVHMLEFNEMYGGDYLQDEYRYGYGYAYPGEDDTTPHEVKLTMTHTAKFGLDTSGKHS